MSASSTRIPDSRQVAAIETARFPGMEHRWGSRQRCRARVCITAGAGITGTARVRDVSSSGAFLETALPMQLFSRLSIAVLGDDGAAQRVQFTASVVRREPDGIGIEWCDPVGGSICRMLGCTRECAAVRLA